MPIFSFSDRKIRLPGIGMFKHHEEESGEKRVPEIRKFGPFVAQLFVVETRHEMVFFRFGKPAVQIGPLRTRAFMMWSRDFSKIRAGNLF